MGDQIKNMIVGLVMLVACAFTIALILFLKPSIGNGEKTYEVRFSNINGIGEGTRVLFAGKAVGEVTHVTEIIDAREQPADELGRVYFYQLTLKIDSSVTIYNTDQLSIQTTGLLGEKSISINPIAPNKNIIPKPIGKEPIYASSSDPLETAFMELSQLANEMEGTFRYVNTWLEKNGDNLSSAVNSFKITLDEAAQTLLSINQSGLVNDAKNGIASFASFMDKLDVSLKEMQEGQFFTNATEMISRLNDSSASVQKITNSLATGKGTIGKLIEEDGMYLRVTALLSKADTMMNDVNHYGVLFHLNKTWQRERLQKMTLMNALDTPDSFKNYFEKEVESVNLAMSRLSMLIEKAQRSPQKQEILKDKQFSKDFALFLQEIDDLSDNVKLYNEQLMEAQIKSGGGS